MSAATSTYAPHEQDINLYCSCKKVLRGLKSNHPLRKQLEYWIQRYDDACALNKGPDFSRSFYWNCIAIDSHRELTSLEARLFGE